MSPTGNFWILHLFARKQAGMGDVVLKPQAQINSLIRLSFEGVAPFLVQAFRAWSEHTEGFAHADDALAGLVGHFAEFDAVAVIAEAMANDGAQAEDFGEMRHVEFEVDTLSTLEGGGHGKHHATDADVVGATVVNGDLPLLLMDDLDTAIDIIALKTPIFRSR